MKITANLLTTVTITPAEQDRIVRERLAQLLGLSVAQASSACIEGGQLLIEVDDYHGSSYHHKVRNANELDYAVLAVMKQL